MSNANFFDGLFAIADIANSATGGIGTIGGIGIYKVQGRKKLK